MAHFSNSLINKFKKVYTVDTLGTWAEAYNVQGESQKTGFIEPKEEKARFYLQIPNVRMHRRQSQTLLRELQS